MNRRQALLFVPLVLAATVTHRRAHAQVTPGSPGAVLEEQASQFEARPVPMSGIRSNLPKVEGNYNRYQSVGPPAEGFDRQTWGPPDPAGQFPLDWEPKSRKFRLRKGVVESHPSRAILQFTYEFLRAYDRLDAPLRESGSTLAVGVAALVAAEKHYRTRWAVLPAELHDAAAIVNLLLLEQPELLDACYSPRAEWRSRLVTEAVQAMWRGSEGKDGVLPSRLIGMGWLVGLPLDQAMDGRRARLSEILPGERSALDRLIGQVRGERGIAHLTIRETIVAASIPARFGFPGSDEKAAPEWRRELAQMIKEVRAELDQHRGGSPLIRGPEVGQPRPIRGDPNVLRPLVLVSGQLAAPRLKEARRKGGVAPADLLRLDADLLPVWDLAGKVPTFLGEGTSGQYGPALVRLEWRFVRDGGRKEDVRIDLMDQTPSGSARTVGIGAGNFMIVEDRPGHRVSRPVGEVKPGMKVLGRLGIEKAVAGRSHLFAAGTGEGKADEVLFTVVTAQTYWLPDCVLVGAGEAGEVLVGPEHAILTSVGDRFGWRRAASLDENTQAWNPFEGEKDGATRIKSVNRWRELNGLQKVVEIVLLHDRKRGQANAVYVAGKKDSPARLLVSARSADAGPIAADQPVLFAGDGAANRPISDLVAGGTGPGRESQAIAGYVIRADDDPWTLIPLVSRHEVRALKAEKVEVEQAIVLEFEDGSKVTLGPGSWVLKAGARIEEIPAAASEVGDSLIAGEDAPGPKPGNAPRLKIRKKAIVEIAVPARAFVQPIVQNVPWIKVGPVLVSVDSIPQDDEAEGVAAGTPLLQPRKTSTGTAASDQLLTLPPRGGRPAPVLLYEPSDGRLGEGTIAAVDEIESTRTVLVEARSGGRRLELETGPDQTLLIRRPEGDTRVDRTPPLGAPRLMNARGLRPRDHVLVLGPDAVKAEPWEVTRVMPRFHASRRIMAVQSPRPPRWDEHPSQPNIAFAGRFAIGLSVPKKVERRPDRPAFQGGAEGQGQAAGARDGLKLGAGAGRANPTGGLLPDGRVAESIEVLSLAEDLKVELLAIGEKVLASYTAERRLLKPPGKRPILLFWENVVARRDVEWPYTSVNLADRLQPWLNYYFRNRARLLESQRPPVSSLPSLVLQGTILASWLRESGAETTSDLILQDMLQLIVQAACEPGHEPFRLGTDGLDLPDLLLILRLARRPGEAEEEVLNLQGRERLEWWSKHHDFPSPAFRNNRISLDELFLNWRKAAREPSGGLPTRPPIQADGHMKRFRPDRPLLIETWLGELADQLGDESLTRPR